MEPRVVRGMVNVINDGLIITRGDKAHGILRNQSAAMGLMAAMSRSITAAPSE